MFLCVVAIGRYVDLGKPTPSTKSIRVPPFLPNSKTQKYDSVYNKGDKHFVIYDNSKAIPGYLITYS